MTKIENETWIAARPQWYFASIGLTNSVQRSSIFSGVVISAPCDGAGSWPEC